MKRIGEKENVGEYQNESISEREITREIRIKHHSASLRGNEVSKGRIIPRGA